MGVKKHSDEFKKQVVKEALETGVNRQIKTDIVSKLFWSKTCPFSQIRTA